MLLTSEKTGAQTTIFCAVDDTILTKSGQLFENCKLGTIRSPVAKSEKMDKSLWEISCQAVGIEQ